MGEVTGIEWCDATLNLWWGCTKVSDGCKNCYAETLSDQRYKKGAWGPKGKRLEVLGWRKTLGAIGRRAARDGVRLRVFVQSMGDLFEGPETMGGVDSENWRMVCRLRTELWSAIWEHKELDFLLLTKRPENVGLCVRGMDSSDGVRVGFPANVWLGTSVEDQVTADARVPKLLEIPASVRFLSCEPLLGPVDLAYPCFNGADSFGTLPGLDWVIVGGESGCGARPMHPDWVRALRDQCVAAGVDFFFKQWGSWCYTRDEVIPAANYNKELFRLRPGEMIRRDNNSALNCGWGDYRVTRLERLSKKAAGRKLDGVLWDQIPGGDV